MYPELMLYNVNVNTIEMHPRWKFCRTNRLLLSSTYECSTPKNATKPNGIKYVAYVNWVSLEILSIYILNIHINCTAEWPKCRPAYWMRWHNGLERMNNKQKKIIGMLLSGTSGSYVAEWDLIYKSILNFVWDIFNTRLHMHCISLDGPGW